jgi:pilus assembly protein CpaE
MNDNTCRASVGNFASELSIALVSPNEKRRAAAAESASHICEFASFLANPADQEKLSQLQFDVIMVDIDDDSERAMKVVEKLSSEGNNRVLVYSSDKNPEKLTRCMRAGARDFLAFPFEPGAMNEALSRLTAPHAATRARREPTAMWRRLFTHAAVAPSQVRL